jgi:hypothetical protein
MCTSQRYLHKLSQPNPALTGLVRLGGKKKYFCGYLFPEGFDSVALLSSGKQADGQRRRILAVLGA